jgi:hypothetical protein
MAALGQPGGMFAAGESDTNRLERRSGNGCVVAAELDGPARRTDHGGVEALPTLVHRFDEIDHMGGIHFC